MSEQEINTACRDCPFPMAGPEVPFPLKEKIPESSLASEVTLESDRSEKTEVIIQLNAVKIASPISLMSPAYAVIAVGQFRSGGWSNPRLIPVVYVQPPVDGIWDIEFIADKPSSLATMQLTY
jgi:hypothetical protein